MTAVPARLCAVEYLNTFPIVYGLGDNRLAHRFHIEYANPAACAERLRHQKVDVALIPSIEYSHIRGHLNLRMVPDVAVTSHGSVQSVVLFFNKGIGDIRTIAVDENSRTSVALLRIILGEKYGIKADLIPMPADIERMLGQADAAMIIGDRALDLAARMDNRIDLGEEWADLTDGLPFVYSLWVGREGALSADDVDILIRSREMGVANIDSIARNYASSGRSNGKPAEFFARYLTENIGFRLGKNELEGLKEYYSYCYYYGMIEEIPEFQFYPHLETRSKLTGSDGRSALMTGRL